MCRAWSSQEVTPTQDINLVVTLQHIFTALLDEFYDAEEYQKLSAERVDLWMEAIFIFALVWSIGGSAGLPESRLAFNNFLMGAVNNDVSVQYSDFMSEHPPLQVLTLP